MEGKGFGTETAVGDPKGEKDQNWGNLEIVKIRSNLKITWNGIPQHYWRSGEVNWGTETQVEKEKGRMNQVPNFTPSSWFPSIFWT